MTVIVVRAFFADGSYDERIGSATLLRTIAALRAKGIDGKQLVDSLLTDDWAALPRYVDIFTDGVEVLRRLKHDTATAKIPVIMLTTTDDPREVARCYELGCNIYLTKPIVYEHFVDAVTRLGMFLVVVKVP